MIWSALYYYLGQADCTQSHSRQFLPSSHTLQLFLTSYRVKEAVYSSNCCNKRQTRSIWDTICTWGRKSSKLNFSRGTTAAADQILPVCCYARHPIVARHVTAQVQASYQTLAIKPKKGEKPETQHSIHSCSLTVLLHPQNRRASWRLREIHICPRDTNRCINTSHVDCF